METPVWSIGFAGATSGGWPSCSPPAFWSCSARAAAARSRRPSRPTWSSRLLGRGCPERLRRPQPLHRRPRTFQARGAGRERGARTAIAPRDHRGAAEGRARRRAVPRHRNRPPRRRPQPLQQHRRRSPAEPARRPRPNSC